MSRRLAAFVMVTGILATALAPGRVLASMPTGWVTWTVNHTTKTITVAAKLQIYLGPCWPATSGGDTGAGGGSGSNGAQGGPGSAHGRVPDCNTSATDIAKAIKKDIEGVWNGHTYRCYRLIFMVDVTVTTGRTAVDKNRVGVRVDRSASNSRSFVDPTISSGVHNPLNDRWESNDPSDRIDPDNGTLHPSTWEWPPEYHVYAHEFGHVLGLDDQYVEGTWEPKPGAPRDIMWSHGTGDVDQTTIDRVVERNRDRLQDTKGRAVDLEDLTCESLFRAYLLGSENDYHASHLVDSLAARPCSRTPVTSSQDQRLTLKSEPVDVALVEDSTAPGGYRLTALFDQLQLQLDPTGQLQRDLPAVGMFDLPVTVTVSRSNPKPASGAVPAVFDVRSGACAGGNGGSPPPADCGLRTYKTWMAMVLGPGTTLWPGASRLPRTLSGIGYSELRLDSLYRLCSGPTPWPGAYRDASGSSAMYGPVPPLAAMQKVADDWLHDARPGQIDIDGGVTRNMNQPGTLVSDAYLWTLTLCPLDKDGKTPPGCP